MLPEIIGGKYRVLRELGRGGMGVLYVVVHEGTGEELALKLMNDRALASPQAVERFKREAKAPARIKSEHVVRVFDADTAPELDGAPFLVMELLDGDNLEALSAEAPAPGVVVDWLKQAARALDRAHALGLVHRDLKPENLFLARRPDHDPIVKVLDFGIVKMLLDSDASDTGVPMGTPRYMSPEQVLAERGTIGKGTDVWAMGFVAFRLLSGREYWAGETALAVVTEILHAKMPPPSERGCDLGPAFDAWFLRSCDRDQAKRFDSVGEQMEALDKALGSQTVPVRRPSTRPEAFGHASTLPISSSGALRLGTPVAARNVTEGAATLDRPARPRGRATTLLVGGVAVASAGALWVAFGMGPASSVPSQVATVAAQPGGEAASEAGAKAPPPALAPAPSAVAAAIATAAVASAEVPAASASASAAVSADASHSTRVPKTGAREPVATVLLPPADATAAPQAPTSKPRGPTDDPL